MNIEEARKVFWLKSNHRPPGVGAAGVTVRERGGVVHAGAVRAG